MQRKLHRRNIFDKRAALQIRIAMNKILRNKNSINTEIANIICEYSHSTIVQKAFMFQYGSPPTFLCVSLVHSPFWITCLDMMGRVAFYQTIPDIGTDFGHLHWVPDWQHCGKYRKKRLFDPFGEPYVKCRNRRFYLKNRCC